MLWIMVATRLPFTILHGLRRLFDHGLGALLLSFTPCQYRIEPTYVHGLSSCFLEDCGFSASLSWTLRFNGLQAAQIKSNKMRK